MSGKKVSRVTDKAKCPVDVHGCNSCPHSPSGPATNGSSNIRVNNLKPLRIGDPGVHSSGVCCGPNTWEVQTGSGTVKFNDIPVARKDDITKHCGGVGYLTGGSNNVYIG